MPAKSTQQPAASTSDQDPSTTIGPADELLDPQRHELITQLLGALKNPKISSITWACLWFADLPMLKEMMDNFKTPAYRTLMKTTVRLNAPKKALIACK